MTDFELHYQKIRQNASLIKQKELPKGKYEIYSDNSLVIEVFDNKTKMIFEQNSDKAFVYDLQGNFKFKNFCCRSDYAFMFSLQEHKLPDIKFPEISIIKPVIWLLVLPIIVFTISFIIHRKLKNRRRR